MRRGALKEALSRHNAAVIVTHRYADVDAVASAHAIRYVALNKLGTPSVDVLCPDGVSARSRSVLERIGISFECLEDPEGYRPPQSALLVLVDVGGVGQLERFSWLLETSGTKVLVDHHTRSEIREAVDLVITLPGAQSSSEVVALSLGELIDDPNVATLLLAGIVADTSRFARASRSTFAAVLRLMQVGSYTKALASLKAEEDISMRMAKLKGAQRTIVEKVGDHIITVTHVSSYESDVASSLISLGSDLALVVSPKEQETRVVIRASERFPGNLLDAVWKRLRESLRPESSGGHARAGVLVLAEVVSKKDASRMCKELSKTVRNVISGKQRTMV